LPSVIAKNPGIVVFPHIQADLWATLVEGQAAGDARSKRHRCCNLRLTLLQPRLLVPPLCYKLVRGAASLAVGNIYAASGEFL
jgi:hypothetical protein